MGFLNKLISKVSTNEEYEQKILDNLVVSNVIGFTSVIGGAGSSSFMCEVTHSLQSSKKSICMVDFHFNKPRIFSYMDCKCPNETMGISGKTLNTAKPIKEFLVDTKYPMVKLFSASFYDSPVEYTEIDPEISYKILVELSNTFDIVLIDFPLDLYSEYTYSVLRRIDKLYCFVDDSIDSIAILKKISAFYCSLGIDNKFTSVIINKVLLDDYRIQDVIDAGLNVAGFIPFIKEVATLYLTGYSVMGNGSNSKFILNYLRTVNKITQEILEVNK